MDSRISLWSQDAGAKTRHGTERSRNSEIETLETHQHSPKRAGTKVQEGRGGREKWKSKPVSYRRAKHLKQQG